MSKELNSLPPAHPIPYSYWVQPGQLLAGEYPGQRHNETPDIAHDKIRRLLLAGVTCFLDLTQEKEPNKKPYADILYAEATAMQRNIHYQRLSIQDMTAPSPTFMHNILQTIDTAIASGHTVYVHCRAGIDRTATVVGCYFVQHGMSGAEALQTITQLRRGTSDPSGPSPGFPEQRQMILSWHEQIQRHNP